MSVESTKAAEVGQLRSKIRRVLDCGTCATGIAIEMVRRHWEPSAEAYDWKGERFEHSCTFVTAGPTPAQDSQLQAIELAYAGTDQAPA